MSICVNGIYFPSVSAIFLWYFFFFYIFIMELTDLYSSFFSSSRFAIIKHIYVS